MSEDKRPEEEEWGPWRTTLDWRPPYTGGRAIYSPVERVREPPDNEALLTKVLAVLQRLDRERGAESPVIDRGEGTKRHYKRSSLTDEQQERLLELGADDNLKWPEIGRMLGEGISGDLARKTYASLGGAPRKRGRKLGS